MSAASAWILRHVFFSGGVLFGGSSAVVDFTNGEWNSKDAWLEYIDTFDQFEDPGTNFEAAINTAIFDMFSKVHRRHGTQVMVSVLQGVPDDTTTSCNDIRDQLQARGILHIVIGIGATSLDWTWVIFSLNFLSWKFALLEFVWTHQSIVSLLYLMCNFCQLKFILWYFYWGRMCCSLWCSFLTYQLLRKSCYSWHLRHPMWPRFSIWRRLQCCWIWICRPIERCLAILHQWWMAFTSRRRILDNHWYSWYLDRSWRE